jgi:hypothetical protein
MTAACGTAMVLQYTFATELCNVIEATAVRCAVLSSNRSADVDNKG